MVQREYKQLGCQDLGADCSFMVRAETGDEVMSLIGEHMCQVHGGCEIAPELRTKLQESMKSVCCQGECYNPPKITGQSCWDVS
jgi:predicted small metal-binding protein